MNRCFPLYNLTTTFSCDDNNDGQPDPDVAPRDHAFEKSEANLCSTMLKSVVSQEPAQPNFVYEQLNTALAIVGRMIGDLAASMVPLLVCGVVLTVALGFTWLSLLRFCARVFVWVTLVLIIVLEIVLTMFFFWKAGMISDNYTSAITSSGYNLPAELTTNETDRETWKWVAAFMTVLSVVTLVVMTAMCRKINIAAQIISEASKAIQKMMCLMAFPIWPVIAITGIFVWFIFVSACLYTVGEITAEDLAVNMTMSEKQKTMNWAQYILFY